MRTRGLIAGALAACVLTLSGCFGQGGGSLNPNPVRSYDYSQMKLVQLEQPYEGQPLAVFDTTEGSFSAVLYPEYAPNTVQNFIDRANDGFYNGQDVYGVFDGLFMSGAADEKKNSGVTADGQPIPNEYSVDLWTFRGAICSYNGNSGYGDSRFVVIWGEPLTDEQKAELKGITNDNGTQLLPDELIEAYAEKGGIAGLAGTFTVFAQVIDGLDTVERIASAPSDGDLYKPVSEILINSVTVTEYHS